MQPTSPFVVSADWLQAKLREPGLTIIDGSWYLPAQGRDAPRRGGGGGVRCRAHSGRHLLRP